MLLTALIIFAIGILIGLFLFSYILRKRETPKGLAMVHGSIGFIGILILCYLVFQYSSIWISLLIFIVAAGGGSYIMMRDIMGKSLPIPLILVHGIIALIGFATLIYFLTYVT